MKTILIKGKQGVGKTILAKELAGKDSYYINDQSFDFRNVLSFQTTIIDDLYSDRGFDELLTKIKRIKKGKFIVCTQNEEFTEDGFDLVFNLKGSWIKEL